MGRIRKALTALVEEKAQTFEPTEGAALMVPLNQSGRPVTFRAPFDIAEHADELTAAARDIWRTNLAEPALCVFDGDTPLYDHPLSQAFARPNQHFTQTMMWRLVSDHLSGPGRGGAYILAVLTFGGEVAELWVKGGDEVRPIRSRETFISGYEWRDGTKWVPVPENVAVVRLYFPDATDIWAHHSPLHDVVKSIRTNDTASQWLDYMLQNGGAPSQVLVVEAAAETAAQMQTRINDDYMGAANVGKVGVIAGAGASSIDLASRLSDVDLGPLKDRLELAVARGYGIPAELLQLYITAAKGEGLAGNSYREKRKILYANKLTPIHRMIEERIALTLCPLYGLDVNALRFDYGALDILDDTPLEKAQRITAMGPYTTIAERRAMMGLDERTDPGIDDIPELVTRNRFSALTAPKPDAPKGDGPHETKALIAREEKAAAFDVKARSYEPLFASIAAGVFADERAAAKKALDALDYSKAIADPDGVIAAALEGVEDEAWRKAFADAIADVEFEAAVSTADGFGVTFDLADPDALDAITRRVTELADDVTSTTEGKIRDLVRDGIADGKTLREVADAITSEVGPLGTKTAAQRAATIARTETIGAMNEGDNIGAKAGGCTTKEWLSAGDAHVRESHLIDGEKVAIDEAFSNGLAYPGDPAGMPDEVINCRCVCLYE